MKRYLILIFSFALMFSLTTLVVQILSGMYITATFTPDITAAWSAVSDSSERIEVISSEGQFLLTLLSATLSAVVAYAITQRLVKNHNQKPVC